MIKIYIDSSDLTCGCVGCIAFVMKTAVNCHYNYSSKLSLQIVWMQLKNVENADIKSILKMYNKLHTNET